MWTAQPALRHLSGCGCFLPLHFYFPHPPATPQLWPGFPAKKRPRHTPKLLLSQISCWMEHVHTHTDTCRYSSNPPNRRLPVASKPQFLPWRKYSLDLWLGVRGKGRKWLLLFGLCFLSLAKDYNLMGLINDSHTGDTVQ